MDEASSGLDALKIASPCSVSWTDMKGGDDRARDCSKCRLTVYNLSAMSRPEAEALIAQKEGRVCVRFFRRFDGTAVIAGGLGLRRVKSLVAPVPLMGAVQTMGEIIVTPR